MFKGIRIVGIIIDWYKMVRMRHNYWSRHCSQVVATGMNRELHRLFDNLAGRTTTFAGRAGRAETSGLRPVNPPRFQVKFQTLYWNRRFDQQSQTWHNDQLWDEDQFSVESTCLQQFLNSVPLNPQSNDHLWTILWFQGWLFQSAIDQTSF